MYHAELTIDSQTIMYSSISNVDVASSYSISIPVRAIILLPVIVTMTNTGNTISWVVCIPSTILRSPLSLSLFLTLIILIDTRIQLHLLTISIVD
jgi:hypothetical protein